MILVYRVPFHDYIYSKFPLFGLPDFLVEFETRLHDFSIQIVIQLIDYFIDRIALANLLCNVYLV